MISGDRASLCCVKYAVVLCCAMLCCAVQEHSFDSPVLHTAYKYLSGRVSPVSKPGSAWKQNDVNLFALKVLKAGNAPGTQPVLQSISISSPNCAMPVIHVYSAIGEPYKRPKEGSLQVFVRALQAAKRSLVKTIATIPEACNCL